MKPAHQSFDEMKLRLILCTWRCCQYSVAEPEFDFLESLEDLLLQYTFQRRCAYIPSSRHQTHERC